MFAVNVDRDLEPMLEELFIYTPLGDVLIVSNLYKNCEVEVDEVCMAIDLIPLDLQEFFIILGMDFLSKYHASMDCYRKEVAFRKSSEGKVTFRGIRKILPTCLISTVKAKKLMRKGCTAYLAHIVDVQAENLKPKDIPVVREYIDVFPEELMGLPPDGKEFTIDLISGTTPISQVTYRMALKELKELKRRLVMAPVLTLPMLGKELRFILMPLVKA